MTTLLLGNTAVVEFPKDDQDQHVRVDRPDLGNQITTVSLPDEWPLDERLRAVGELWPWHSDDPPEWVECDDDLLAQVVAAKFTSEGHECVVGRPKGWQEG